MLKHLLETLEVIVCVYVFVFLFGCLCFFCVCVVVLVFLCGCVFAFFCLCLRACVFCVCVFFWGVVVYLCFCVFVFLCVCVFVFVFLCLCLCCCVVVFLCGCVFACFLLVFACLCFSVFASLCLWLRRLPLRGKPRRGETVVRIPQGHILHVSESWGGREMWTEPRAPGAAHGAPQCDTATPQPLVLLPFLGGAWLFLGSCTGAVAEWAVIQTSLSTNSKASSATRQPGMTMAKFTANPMPTTKLTLETCRNKALKTVTRIHNDNGRTLKESKCPVKP